MSAEPKPKRTSADRMRDYRARMRARGLKPRTIWTYDEKDPEFVELVQAQFQSLKDDPEHQAWVRAMESEPDLDEEA